jgi:ABC-type transporter Mla subunit MlaD
MAFDKVILGVITRTVKSTARFDIAINSIKTQFDNGCPAPQELTKIIQQKNQINQALTQALGALNTINSTAGTINGILTGIDAAITTIKALPIPSAITPLAPAGVGPSLIPGRIFPILADALIILRDFVKTNKGVINQIPSAISSIQVAIQGTINNLNSLDTLISGCLNKQTENLSPEAKEAYFNEIGFALTQTGNNSNPNINANVDSILEAQLQPNSVNPLLYKGFKLTLEYDSTNRFSFPSRRIKGVNDETGQIVYNYGGKFSYSSSTQVLFDEIKYQIDILTPTVNAVDEVNDIIKEVGDTVNAAQAEAERLAEEARIAAEEARRAAEEARRAAEEALNPPPPPPPPFPPFGEAGYNNELRYKFGESIFDLGTFYQFKSDPQKWVEITFTEEQLRPFGYPGFKDGEEAVYIYQDTIYGSDTYPVNINETYVWSNDSLRWIFQNSTY